VKPSDGYVLNSHSMAGTIIGSLIGGVFLLFLRNEAGLELMAMFGVLGMAIGWFVGFIKLGGET